MPQSEPVGIANGTLPPEEAPYLSVLPMLCDEYEALGGDVSRLRQLRERFADLSARPKGDRPEQEQAELDQAERELRAALFARLHEARRAGLCFSGGCIRSETFGLGVLQGLARWSAQPDGTRAKLLGEFDFLSTVSGGGYLGGWVSAWAARLESDSTTIDPPAAT